MDTRPIRALLALLASSPVPVRRISASVSPDGQAKYEIELNDAEPSTNKAAAEKTVEIAKPKKRRDLELLGKTPPSFDFSEVQ